MKYKLLLASILLSVNSHASGGVSSVGIKLGVSDVDYNAKDERKSSSGIDYGIDYTWLNYLHKNVSIGLNISADRFENQLYGNYESKHTAIIVSPIISYRFLTLTPEFLGVEHLRFHDGLSIYVKMGLGWADSSIKHELGSMDQNGAIGSYGVGLKWQSTGAWAFSLEYSQLDNKLWGIGGRDYGVESSSVLGILSYRFE